MSRRLNVVLHWSRQIIVHLCSVICLRWLVVPFISTCGRIIRISRLTSSPIMASNVKKRAQEFLNYGDEDQMEIFGYTRNNFKTFVTWAGIVCTAGLLRLVFHWWPHLLLYSTHTECALHKAERVLVLETYGKHSYKRNHVKKVFHLHPSSETGSIALLSEDGNIRACVTLRYFFCKKLRYVWDDKFNSFKKLQAMETATAHFLHSLPGLNASEQSQRRVVFGNNEIRIEVTPILKLLLLEILNPFYVFQVFSIALWMSDYYYWYAAAIILMSVAGVTSTVYQTRQNQTRLRKTVHSSDIVEVLRGQGKYEVVASDTLVPGDVIVIPPHGSVINCDAVLLSGNCIVNESMLTGESVPVTKTPMPQEDIQYNIREHGRHTLFCGTKVIQTRYYGQEKVHAAVIRTGFLTTKGLLVRSILYPPPADYKFERDSYKFVGFMAAIASVGFLASVWWKVKAEETVRAIVVQSLDLITIVIPPALPAAMTVGRIFALRRLENKGIYCTSPRTVTVTGSIDCVCFDKTGTLTEEGLDLRMVLPTVDSNFGDVLAQNPSRTVGNFALMEAGMAACHSLTRISEELVGDPLDLKVFEWTGWKFEEPDISDNEKFDRMIPAVVSECNVDNPKQVGIIRQFPFSSSLQRMGVITRTLHEEDFQFFCKGSPEKVVSLCDAATVPADFTSTLAEYTTQGFRVIAMAHRRLPELSYTKVTKVGREEVEGGLSFLGLIVLENRLKAESAAEIRVLQAANIRTIMATGDNLQTSTSVAIECGLVAPADRIFLLDAVDSSSGTPTLTVDEHSRKNPPVDPRHTALPIHPKSHVALTGRTFHVVSTHFPHLLPKILSHGTIFARMSPDQKQQLVEGLQAAGHFVGMCGDGANDCGALKAAHAGVSLSEAEASVASPFTYNRNNISCISTVIQEGRTALVTSFGIFKYMVIYSFTQFLSMLILYTASTNLSDAQFLYIDLFLISLFALFFGYTEPHPTLSPNPPPFSLISFRPLLSIVLQTAAIFAVQLSSMFLVEGQSWFEEKEASDDTQDVWGYENYTLFTVSVFQYIVMVLVYSQGKPYRKPIWTNWRLCGSVVVMTLFTIYLVLIPATWLEELFVMRMPEKFSFQLILMALVGGHCVVAFVIEEGLVNLIGNRVDATERYKKSAAAAADQSDEKFPLQFKDAIR